MLCVEMIVEQRQQCQHNAAMAIQLQSSYNLPSITAVLLDDVLYQVCPIQGSILIKC